MRCALANKRSDVWIDKPTVPRVERKVRGRNVRDHDVRYR
jgi:hypothetical protein